MTSLMVIPSALENSAASFGAGRMSGHRTIRVNPATVPPGCGRGRAGRGALAGRAGKTGRFAVDLPPARSSEARAAIRQAPAAKPNAADRPWAKAGLIRVGKKPRLVRNAAWAGCRWARTGPSRVRTGL